VDGGLAIGQDGTVYVPFGGVVRAYPRTLGAPRWSYSTGSDIDSNLGIMNTRFVCCTPQDFVHTSPNGATGVIQLRWDGTRVWQRTFVKHGSNNGAPVFDSDGDVYVPSSDGHLYAFQRDGTPKWSLAAGGDNQTPALAPGRVYFVSAGGQLHAVGP
jgi:outer membrane protein assembly factor BamB